MGDESTAIGNTKQYQNHSEFSKSRTVLQQELV